MHLLSDLVAIGTGHSMISVSDSGLKQWYLDLTQGQEILNFTSEIADIFPALTGIKRTFKCHI